MNLLFTYIPPNFNSEQAIQQVVDTVSDLQAKSPDSVTIFTGDFNHNTLENELPLYYQYINCPTRGKNVLDFRFGNIKDDCKCKALPGLGKSDHQMMQLTPKYRTVLKKSKVDKQVVSVWIAENTEMLQDCFDRTDWTVFEDSFELTDSITEYIKFCENVTIKKKEIIYFPNSKPWINKELREVLSLKLKAFKSRDKEALIKWEKKIKAVVRECRKTIQKEASDRTFLKPTIHAGMGMWVVPGIRTRIQIARSLVTIHAEIRTRVAPGQGESPKFPRPCHQSSRGRGIP
ncbi:hypothetical protein ElyMa_000923400 [Elysia marginata]|uniref:Endonuclease/exonuclease/phosphatase domain-containing protein n=1 Tax=Elysia marginata TaxID=1093978 RepID=A0AAV4HDF9_9GAST|nr:hypothetical protein ElyMa_000923400 [Elysia marginata]